MDKTILNLLFNYKGTVTYREFRAGIIIVFISVGTQISFLLTSAISNILSARMGAEWLAANTVYNQITSSFVPSFIPIWFIVSYTSFVLALKRIRAISQNRTLGVASGIINYLFFASLVAQLYLLAYGLDLQGTSNYMQLITPLLKHTIHAFVVIGIINLIYLSIQRKTEQCAITHTKGKLDTFTYCIKLGNLMTITTVVAITIGIFMKLTGFSSLYSNTTFQIIAGACCIIPTIFSIKYAALRLRDANISILWLASTIAIYTTLFGLKIWINLNIQNGITTLYNTMFAIATSIYVALYYLLFLLPTENK